MLRGDSYNEADVKSEGVERERGAKRHKKRELRPHNSLFGKTMGVSFDVWR